MTVISRELQHSVVGRDPVFPPFARVEVKASIESWGWSAEMRLPFRSLRFKERGDQRWGAMRREGFAAPPVRAPKGAFRSSVEQPAAAENG